MKIFFVQKNERIRNDLEQYKTRWGEAQHTLEELGVQLSVSKLQISEMKEKLEGAPDKNGDVTPTWTPDKFSTHCSACCKEFTVTRRRVRSMMEGTVFVMHLTFSTTVDIVGKFSVMRVRIVWQYYQLMRQEKL